jgi:hypothetical protein
MNPWEHWERWGRTAPGWIINLIALLSAMGGAVILWATGHFCQKAPNISGFAWIGWIKLSLLMLAGVMGLLAAVLLVRRSPAGWEVLGIALGVLLLLLALGRGLRFLNALGNLWHRLRDLIGFAPFDIRLTCIGLVLGLIELWNIEP